MTAAHVEELFICWLVLRMISFETPLHILAPCSFSFCTFSYWIPRITCRFYLRSPCLLLYVANTSLCHLYSIIIYYIFSLLVQIYIYNLLSFSEFPCIRRSASGLYIVLHKSVYSFKSHFRNFTIIYNTLDTLISPLFQK